MKTLSILSMLLSTALANAQVDVDKPINLSGVDGDRKITNLELPVDGTDAVNKDYVDNAVAATGGGSPKPEAISNEAPTTMVFHQAVQYCENLNEGGYPDWRIPTLQEALYFAGSSTNQNYFWTLSESPGLDFGSNQNFISTRLSDGKWSNGGSSTFFSPPRSTSASGLTNGSWTTAGTFLPLISGNAFVPTSISLSISENQCNSIHNFRIVYNVDNGPSITSPVYQTGCYSSNPLNLTNIPLASSITPYSSIDVQHFRSSGSSVGSFTLTVGGYETNFSQRDGNTLHVRCVR